MATSLTTRQTAGAGAIVKGAPLTNTEVDGNFISITNNKLEADSNLSDLDDASAARSNLGLEIGVDVQAFDANNATFDAVNPTFTDTGALGVPTGTQAQRPGTPASGQIRFNADVSVSSRDITELSGIQLVAVQRFRTILHLRLTSTPLWLIQLLVILKSLMCRTQSCSFNPRPVR